MEDFAAQQALVDRLVKGDGEAFALLYKQLQKPLYLFALRYTDEMEAEDILSEVFISLWNKRTDFSVFGEIRTFLFVAVRNRCLNVLKHQKVRAENQQAIITQLEETEENVLELEQLHVQLITHIYAELDKLPPKMREIFLLSFREGLKPAAIAERLQLSVQTVRNQKASAIQRLKAVLGNKHFTNLLLLLQIL